MKKTLITLTALMTIAFFTANAFAWGHGNGKRGGCRGQNNPMYDNLTDDQKTQLKELRQQFVDETYETRSAIFAKHQEMRMLMETSNPDKSKLKAMVNDMAEMKKVMALKGIDFALKAKEIAPELRFPMGFGQKGGFGKGGFGGECFGPFAKGKNKNSDCPRGNAS
ncbi:MAG: periplasmic heavy metal sensor [Desulfobacterales bacterium]|nr:periplasmic heavy metal sensor [Desulfobacterales bacterium]